MDIEEKWDSGIDPHCVLYYSKNTQKITEVWLIYAYTKAYIFMFCKTEAYVSALYT